jgi:hypothetical protein
VSHAARGRTSRTPGRAAPLALLALLLPVAGCARDRPPPAVLTVAVQAPPVGLQRTVHSTLTSTVAQDAGGRREQQVDTSAAVSHAEVLEVIGDVVTKLRVRYDQQDRSTTPGAPAAPSPLVGNTYVLTVVGGAIAAHRVQDGAEQLATPREQDLLLAEHDDLGTVPGLVRLLASQPWTEDERVALAGPALRLTQDEFARDGDVLEAATLTFTGLTRGVASFRLALDLRLQAELLLAATVDLELEVARALPRRVAMTASGEHTAQTPQGPVAVRLTIEATKTFEYP